MVYYTIFEGKSDRFIEHKIAYELLKKCLFQQFGISDYTIKTGEFGKPYLLEYPDIKFNLSHCTNLAVCGISDKEIGADAELVRKYNPNAMRIFSPNERRLVETCLRPEYEFFRIWTLKEALGKYTGRGIFSGMSGCELELSENSQKCPQYPVLQFTQHFIKGKWIISVCSEVTENQLIMINS